MGDVADVPHPGLPAPSPPQLRRPGPPGAARALARLRAGWSRRGRRGGQGVPKRRRQAGGRQPRNFIAQGLGRHAGGRLPGRTSQAARCRGRRYVRAAEGAPTWLALFIAAVVWALVIFVAEIRACVALVAMPLASRRLMVVGAAGDQARAHPSRSMKTGAPVPTIVMAVTFVPHPAHPAAVRRARSAVGLAIILFVAQQSELGPCKRAPARKPTTTAGCARSTPSATASPARRRGQLQPYGRNPVLRDRAGRSRGALQLPEGRRPHAGLGRSSCASGASTSLGLSSVAVLQRYLDDLEAARLRSALARWSQANAMRGLARRGRPCSRRISPISDVRELGVGRRSRAPLAPRRTREWVRARQH